MIEPGQICRDLTRKTFRIGIVLGPSLRGDKLRICRWQPDNDVANGHWCTPKVLLESQLEPLTPDFDLTSRRGLIVSAARRTVVGGLIRWKVNRCYCGNDLVKDFTEVHYVGTVRP